MRAYAFIDDGADEESKELVQTLWVCPDCENREEVNVWEWEELGTPYCIECDENMMMYEVRIYEDKID